MAVAGHALSRRPPPAAMPGFRQVQRFWDSQIGRWAARVLPGELYVTCGDEAISTVLGSCIAACIGDRTLGIGGLNHFMLPEDGSSGATDRWLDPGAGLATRYGSYAMECLVNELLKLGAMRRRLEIKLFGAAQIPASIADVGARNIAFARDYLRTEGLPVTAEDLGDVCPRHIVYFPATGKVRLRRLEPLEATAVAARERRYMSDMATRDVGGQVELF